MLSKPTQSSRRGARVAGRHIAQEPARPGWRTAVARAHFCSFSERADIKHCRPGLPLPPSGLSTGRF